MFRRLIMQQYPLILNELNAVILCWTYHLKALNNKKRASQFTVSQLQKYGNHSKDIGI